MAGLKEDSDDHGVKDIVNSGSPGLTIPLPGPGQEGGILSLPGTQLYRAGWLLPAHLMSLQPV